MLKLGITRHGRYRPLDNTMLLHQAINDISPTTPTDYGAIEGLTDTFTAHMEFTDAAFQSFSATEILFWIGDSASTFNNYIQISKINAGSNDRLALKVRSGATFTVSISAFSLSCLNGKHKLTLDVSPSRIVVYLDGFKLFDRDSAFTFPANLSDGVNLGQANNATLQFGGSFTKFEFYTASALATVGESWLRSKSSNTEIITGKTFDGDLDIIAFLGQSNSSGQASGTPTYPNAASMKMIRNNFALENYTDPFDNAAGSLLPVLDDASPALGHAGFMLDKIIDTRAGIYAAAPLNIASTSMASHWGQDLALSLFNTDSTSGTKHAGTTLTAAIQGLITLKTMGNLKAIVFHQGEADAVNGVSQADYETYLEGMFHSIWGAVGHVPVILNTLHAHNSSTGATATNWNNIIAAQAAWAATKGNVLLNDISDVSAPDVHLDTTGQQTAGERAAALYLANI